MFKTVAFAGIFALTAMFAGSAKAQNFPDGAKVTIKHKDWNTGSSDFTLNKVGETKSKEGIYTIESTSGPFLVAFKNESKVGTNVGFSKKGEKVTPTKWILNDNGGVYTIMHADDGANTISVIKDNKLELQRNQGDKHQKFEIKAR